MTALLQQAVPTAKSTPREPDGVLDYLLVDVTYQHFRVDSVVSALQDSGGTKYLPLRRLSTALGFRLDVDPGHKRASGFLTAPSDRLELDGNAGIARRHGVAHKFSQILCFARDGDLYVEAGVLSEITGLRLDWKMNRLELNILSDAPMARPRRLAAKRSGSNEPGIDAPSNSIQLETATLPYRFWSLPAMDFQLYSVADFGHEDGQKTSVPSVEGRGDLLYMSSRYRLTTDVNGAPYGLLTLGRSDPGARLLGPLKAKQFEIGDLVLPSFPLLSRGRVGYGFSTSNFPLAAEDLTGETQVAGRAPPHTLIELYRDDALLAATYADEGGVYEFSGLPLDSGPNYLRIVVVGGDGDVHEEVRTVYGDASAVKAGRTIYRLTAGQAGRTLFGSNALGGTGQDARVVSGEFRTGVAPGSWMSLNVTGLDGTGYLGLGFHSWHRSTQWHLQTLAGENGSRGVSIGAVRKIGTTSVSLEHTRLTGAIGNGVLPEISEGADTATSLRLDGMVGPRGHQLSYGLSLDRYNGVGAATDIRGRMSGGSGSVFFSNNMEVRFSDQVVDGSGLFQLRKQFGSSFGRLDLGYGISDSMHYQVARLSLDQKIANDFRIHFGIEDDNTRDRALGVFGTVYRTFGSLSVGVTFGADGGGIKTSLLLLTGLGYSGSSSRFVISKPGSSSASKLQARVYLDQNGNGVFDRGDTLLPGIGLKVSGRPYSARTGKNGICTLDRFQDKEVTLSLNEDTFEDPSWVAAKVGVRAQPRPGARLTVDLGVIATSELDGTAVFNREYQREHPGMQADLLDPSGKVVSTSVFDELGTFVFSRVRPGDYRVQVTDLQGQILATNPVHVENGAQPQSIVFQLGDPLAVSS